MQSTTTTTLERTTPLPAQYGVETMDSVSKTILFQANSSQTTSALAPDGSTTVLIEPGTFSETQTTGEVSLNIVQGTLASEPEQTDLMVLSKVLQIQVPSSNISRPVLLKMLADMQTTRRRRILQYILSSGQQTVTSIKVRSLNPPTLNPPTLNPPTLNPPTSHKNH
jgi:hypothetical protein